MTNKERRQYRQAAKRLKVVFVSSHANVTETADKDGAFVEVVMWVPKEEADKESGEEE